jgi:hypothetical protein
MLCCGSFVAFYWLPYYVEKLLVNLGYFPCRSAPAIFVVKAGILLPSPQSLHEFNYAAMPHIRFVVTVGSKRNLATTLDYDSEI